MTTQKNDRIKKATFLADEQCAQLRFYGRTVTIDPPLPLVKGDFYGIELDLENNSFRMWRMGRMNEKQVKLIRTEINILKVKITDLEERKKRVIEQEISPVDQQIAEMRQELIELEMGLPVESEAQL